jgi:DNA-nicking Smr family endonuclease
MSSSSKTRRRPDPDDLAAWAAVTDSVAPLPGRTRPHPPKPVVVAEPAPRARRVAAAPAPEPRKPAAMKPAPLESLAGIDKRNADRFRRGELPIEGKLDLHGLTQAEAHGRLVGFVERAHADGKRCLLVVTGKGREGVGVLKRALPHWLGEAGLRGRILAIATARQHHGGGGATYLLLKRKR